MENRSSYKEQLNHEWALIDTNREGVTENPTLTLRVQKLNALILSLDAEFIGFSPLFVFISVIRGSLLSALFSLALPLSIR